MSRWCMVGFTGLFAWRPSLFSPEGGLIDIGTGFVNSALVLSQV